MASGRKQLSLIYALFDHFQLRQQQPTELIKRSAELFRESVKPTLPKRVVNIDRHVVLLLDAGGPLYANATKLLERLTNEGWATPTTHDRSPTLWFEKHCFITDERVL